MEASGTSSGDHEADIQSFAVLTKAAPLVASRTGSQAEGAVWVVRLQGSKAGCAALQKYPLGRA